MAKFHKQEQGLLVPPAGFDKWHISWSLENVLEGFRHFYKLHARWPIASDLRDCEYLPTAKTLERKFGGIVEIRKLLKVENPHYNSGEWRSNRARNLWNRAFESEERVYGFLVERFHEPYVHNQGRILLDKGRSGRADFIVFHKSGKFFIDVFYPDKGHGRFITNCAAKARTYQKITARVFCVVVNPEVTESMIAEFVAKVKTSINKNVTFISWTDFRKRVESYVPLVNPY